PAVTSLANDARVARLVRGRAPRYPVPSSHHSPSFAQSHGALASSSTATCANCHAQASCQTCHLGSMGARVIGKLPRPVSGSAAGVRLEGADPSNGESPPRAEGLAPQSDGRRDAFAASVRQQDTAIQRRTVALTDTQRARRVFVHPPGFARAHGPAAASGQLNCAGCHQQRFCTSCHQGEGERRYHPFNFVSRHASTAYARETSCTSCHNTETFCRACHEKSGIAGASTSRRLGAAHGAQPLWLLQHGQAARQGLQSCAGCHQQTDCLRCHSTVTQRVNPHGPDFDAPRMAARNKIVCQYCHLGDPLK
ncbi:MAG: cytochrome c family protein, partial [Gemmatimonadetes bacterium]|nr:cytochrome c family protein [Gemmatimonadota bacterium]